MRSVHAQLITNATTVARSRKSTCTVVAPKAQRPEAAAAAAPPEPEAAEAAALPVFDAAAAAAAALELLKPARIGSIWRSCMAPQRGVPPNAQRVGWHMTMGILLGS